MATEPMNGLAIRNLTKRFNEGADDEVLAVDDLSIEIDDGEFVVFVGPSGCGKTTTLRTIAGLEDPTTGEILLDGDDLTTQAPQDRNTAMVFQSYALYPHMTIRKNIGFGLKHSTDLTAEEIDSRVEEVAEMMGIGSLLDRKPDELSGGQQQRVALGRAIVRDPAVFLLDEPLSNLDAKLRAQMRTELQRLQADLGVTTIYVTHDQTEAMTMGDRIAILNEGRLQQVGTPMECYHEPKNRFVAGFIGEPSMNFLQMERRESTLVGGGIEYQLSNRTQSALEGADRVTLGIRPEDVEIVDEASQPNDFPFRIEVVEPVGKESNLYLLPNDSEEDGAEMLTCIVEGRHSYTEGDEVVVRLDEDVIHLFDTRSGEARYHGTIASREQDLPA